MSELLSQLNNNILTLTLNRPEKLNTLTLDLVKELTTQIKEAEYNHDVLCIIINAAGEKAFSAGGNIKEEIKLDGYTSYDFSRVGQELIRAMRNARMPIITAAHGYALGGGMEIILASDFAFLSDTAKIAIPSINLGSTNGFGGTQLLPRIVGAMRAKEILMTGRHISAAEAMELGIALKAVPKNELINEATMLANDLTAKAPFALRCIKSAVNKALETDIETGLLIESQLFSRAQASEDKQNGMQSFINKTAPNPFINR